MYIIFSLLLFIPSLAIAAVGDFVPLAPIPRLPVGGATTLGEYVNAAFLLIIAVAAMIAVLRLVSGGFKYMIEESISAKGDARTVIQNTIIGLLLLLGSWVILTTINPQIVDLSALRFTSLQSDGIPTTPVNDREQTSRDLAAGTDVIDLKNSGYKDQVERAIREKAGFSCTTTGGNDCADTIYPITSVVYGTNYAEITVQSLNPNDAGTPKYGESITKRVTYEGVKTELCSQSTAQSPIPGC